MKTTPLNHGTGTDPSTRAGFTMVEMLLALAIGATLLAATASSLAAFMNCIRVNDAQASAIQVARGTAGFVASSLRQATQCQVLVADSAGVGGVTAGGTSYSPAVEVPATKLYLQRPPAPSGAIPPPLYFTITTNPGTAGKGLMISPNLDGSGGTTVWMNKLEFIATPTATCSANVKSVRLIMEFGPKGGVSNQGVSVPLAITVGIRGADPTTRPN